jgi:hypothetical protein
MRISFKVATNLWWSYVWRHVLYCASLGLLTGVAISAWGVSQIVHSPAQLLATTSGHVAALPGLSALDAPTLLGCYGALALAGLLFGILAMKQAVVKHLRDVVASVNANRAKE